MKSRKEVVKWIHGGHMPVKPTAPAPGLAPTPTVVGLVGVKALLNFIYGETPEPSERLLALDALGYKQRREELDRLIKQVKEHPAYMGEFDGPCWRTADDVVTDALLYYTAKRYRVANNYGDEGLVLINSDGVAFGWTLDLSTIPPGEVKVGDLAVDINGAVHVARKGAGAPIVWEQLPGFLPTLHDGGTACPMPGLDGIREEAAIWWKDENLVRAGLGLKVNPGFAWVRRGKVLGSLSSLKDKQPIIALGDYAVSSEGETFKAVKGPRGSKKWERIYD